MDFKLQWQMGNISLHLFRKLMGGVGNCRLFCDGVFLHVQLGSPYRILTWISLSLLPEMAFPAFIFFSLIEMGSKDQQGRAEAFMKVETRGQLLLYLRWATSRCLRTYQV